MDEYIVLFGHADSTKQLNRSELRPHLEWKDGKWLIHHDGAASSSAPKSKRKRKSCFSPLKRHRPQIEYDHNVQQLIDEEDSRVPNEERRHIDEDGDDVENDRDVQQLIDEEDSRAPNEETELIDEDGDDIEYDRDVQQVIDEDSISRAPNEDSEQKLPFVKRNAIWKSIEWTEVLRRMPHFEPLLAFRENQRERLAIGCIVTFTNVVEASRRLKFTDPKSEADDLLETLLDLEEYGFQVGAVREWVTKLLKAKEEEERLRGSWSRLRCRVGGGKGLRGRCGR